MVLTGWDEEICCFVITPVAFDEEDVALDDDDDAASAEDAPTLAVDDATLAEDVFAFDLMDGDRIWLLVVEEMLNFTVINRKENFF